MFRLNKERILRRVLKNSSGFTLIGVLVASTIGVIAILGLAQLSVNIVGTLNRAKQELNLVLLSEEIRHTFQQSLSTFCDPNVNDCFNACTSSLIGYNVHSAGFIIIREPSISGVGNEVYKGGQVWKGVKIQEIRFKPQAVDKGHVVIQFSLSDDTRETLMAPKPLNFRVFIDEVDSADNIKKCTIAGTFI